jgi:hypothetical protein
MIKSWINFNESESIKKKYGHAIQDKMDLLFDLSLELQDEGLVVEIWNPKDWSDTIDGIPKSDFIMMRIKDEEGLLDTYFVNHLKDKKIIKDFEKQLTSYKIPYDKMTGECDTVYYYFKKKSKLSEYFSKKSETESDYFKKKNTIRRKK